MNLIVYNVGDGNDTIEGFNATSTLKIGNGSATYSKATVDSDIVVTVGDGKISLIGAASLDALNIEGEEILLDNPLLIEGIEGNNYIKNTLDGATILALGGNDNVTNTGSNVLIDLGDGFDTLDNDGSNVTIIGGTGLVHIESNGEKVLIRGSDGSDGIYNYRGDDSTIDGGAGNDNIDSSYSNKVSINAGEGDDTISSRDSDSVTINGGAGNDRISLGTAQYSNGEQYIKNINNYNVIEYASGDGNDTIYGYNPSDTLNLINESVTST